MAQQSAVYVSGLKEIRTAVRRLSPELVPEMRAEFRKVGEKVVIDAKARTPVGPPPKGKKKRPGHPGKARSSIRVVLGGNTVYIAGGKKSVEYFGWLDFGGVLLPTGQRKLRTKGKTFTGTGFKYRIVGQATGGGRRNRISRPYMRSGRIIYAAIKANEEQILDGAVEALDRIRTKVGL